MRIWTYAVVASVVLSSASSAEEPSGDQFVDRKTHYQLNLIGQLETVEPVTEAGKQGAGVGTGFLISPCYALSAGHVVSGNRFLISPSDPGINRSDFETKYKMKFFIGVGVHLPFATMVYAVPQEWGFASYEYEDWVLLRLSSCVGRRLGWMELDPNYDFREHPNERPVFLASYPGDKTDPGGSNLGKSMHFSKGIVLPLPVKFQSHKTNDGTGQDGMIAYRIGYSSPGSSGGPIMVKDKNGLTRVVGVHHNFAAFVGVRHIIMQPRVIDIINRDRDDFGQPNPAYQALREPFPGVN